MITLPACYETNDHEFVPCFQQHYIRPLMPPFVLPLPCSKVIPPHAVFKCNDAVSWRRHIRGDLVWYDFIHSEVTTDVNYWLSRKWYLPNDIVNITLIKWYEMHARNSTLIDNGSPLLDAEGGA